MTAAGGDERTVGDAMGLYKLHAAGRYYNSVSHAAYTLVSAGSDDYAAGRAFNQLSSIIIDKRVKCSAAGGDNLPSGGIHFCIRRDSVII